MSILNAVANFNPRSPHRERRDYRVKSTVLPLFQSTLPSQGATAGQETPKADIEISIHAPLTGSDHNRKFTIIGKCNFNPRSPHRERRELIAGFPKAPKFQSTLPSQGATVCRLRNAQTYQISIHAPLTGSDIQGCRLHCLHHDFNPRSPHRERQLFCYPYNFLYDFNPRSPHRERRTMATRQAG